MCWKRFSSVAFTSALCLTMPALGESLDGALRPAAGTCVADAQTLCLSSGKFALTVDFDDGEKASGPGTVLAVGNDAWGFFYLEDDRHLELFAQVLDACSFNGHYWVTLIGLSDHAQTVNISQSGMVVKTYDNPAGNFFGVADTAAIPCARAAFEEVVPRAPMVSRNGPGPQPLTLDRFEITTEWEDFTMTTGDGQPVAVTPHSGFFYFFTPDNPDVVVKFVDKSSINGNFWLFFGSQTTVEFTLRVVDSCDGSTISFFKPAGVAGGTVVDMSSFPSVSACLLFADGFESGDTVAWSASVGLRPRKK